MNTFSRRMLLVAGLALASITPARAEDILLTIETASGQEEHFDRERLLALPQHELVTHTSVTDGVQTFTGPFMRDLLAEAGVTAETLTAIALNDYQIELPAEDFTRYDVVAALEMNGETLTPRDKGPIWIVYPRDEFVELQDIYYDYRWVWQLVRLEEQ
ncbi:hypothetical protein SAMN06297129_3692 [Pseudooceanicola antarcticus]|uniref:Oxidoreductase molybdopterin-binding domain-containing protein n=1 Tax=Pseudooceanicola antarcticus TaxID=1247613 RepID=A0A285JI64_9RHOB|nr:hypothetical protein CVM39_04095 [Pseudooceanicola antarcticus]SNY59066.1 hypothetical protein SAMN06297129_3692 [Pseudooceanicola antarcticus]